MLKEAGADIIGVSASLEISGSAVEEEVQNRGKSFTAYQCDFSDRKALYAFIAQVKSDFPVIDILVNNAGTILRAPAVEHSDEYWDKVIEVNQSAQFILTREFGKEMVARDFYSFSFDLSGRNNGSGLCGQQGCHRANDHGLCE